MTKNGLIIIFTYYHNPYSLIFGVFGVFGRFLVIFSAINGYPTLSTPGLGGVIKMTKNGLIIVFTYFHDP